MSARNSHLDIENESLKSELKNIRADYAALQTDMSDVREYYHQVDIAASKMGHRCEVCMGPVFYTDHIQGCIKRVFERKGLTHRSRNCVMKFVKIQTAETRHKTE